MTVCFLGLFVNGRYVTACRYSGPMVWNSASVTFLKICYYRRQWDLIWCNDASIRITIKCFKISFSTHFSPSCPPSRCSPGTKSRWFHSCCCHCYQTCDVAVHSAAHCDKPETTNSCVSTTRVKLKGQVRSGQVRSEYLTCTFRASCCSTRLLWAQVLAFAGSYVRDMKI